MERWMGNGGTREREGGRAEERVGNAEVAEWQIGGTNGE